MKQKAVMKSFQKIKTEKLIMKKRNMFLQKTYIRKPTFFQPEQIQIILLFWFRWMKDATSGLYLWKQSKGKNREKQITYPFLVIKEIHASDPNLMGNFVASSANYNSYIYTSDPFTINISLGKFLHRRWPMKTPKFFQLWQSSRNSLIPIVKKILFQYYHIYLFYKFWLSRWIKTCHMHQQYIFTMRMKPLWNANR